MALPRADSTCGPGRHGSTLAVVPPPRPAPAGDDAPLTVAALDRALDAGCVVAVYQPVHDLRSGHVVGVEALARLRHPDTGRLLAPAEFVPLSERSGRAHLVDDAVASLAVPQAAAWRALRPGRPFSVGLNVSASRLWDRGLPARLQASAAAAGLPMDCLVIELTETALSDPDAGHDAVLWELADLGVNVTMDDFCTGYSALTHLLRLPVQGIKIDRAFVAASGTRRGRQVLAGLQALGDQLDVHVVAEGIETTEQLDLLREIGTPFGQGYLFSRPLPVDGLTQYLLAPPA
ncbi:MAG: hypothetical protein JWN08_640 [Frankiales bacterium]|nr:hypothetical protein [Frankiales bacterium]